MCANGSGPPPRSPSSARTGYRSTTRERWPRTSTWSALKALFGIRNYELTAGAPSRHRRSCGAPGTGHRMRAGRQAPPRPGPGRQDRADRRPALPGDRGRREAGHPVRPLARQVRHHAVQRPGPAPHLPASTSWTPSSSAPTTERHARGMGEAEALMRSRRSSSPGSRTISTSRPPRGRWDLEEDLRDPLPGAARARRHLARGRRDRHHEHHADGGERADPRDRHPEGARRAPARHPGPVRRRVGDALRRGALARHRVRARARLHGEGA